MKNLLQTSLIALLVLTNSFLFSQIDAKSYWEKYDTTNGLISNNISEVLIENDSNLWIISDSGLTHFDGLNFNNYTAQNSNFPGGASDLLLSQNKLWMISGPSLVSFDGQNFSIYNTSNGLLNSRIRDIATTSNDTIWICYDNGVSKFDGSTFTHYPAEIGWTIETDSADHVYLATVAGYGRLGLVSMYENGSWTDPTPTGDTAVSQVSYFKLRKTRDGGLYAVSRGLLSSSILKISYPLNYEELNFRLDGVEINSGSFREKPLNTYFLNRIEGQFWFGIDGYGSMLIGSTRDSLVRGVFGQQYNYHTTLDVNKDFIVVGTKNGVLISNTKFRTENIKGERFSVNQIATDVRISDPLFSNTYDRKSNLEFPKNSGNHGAYAAQFIVAGKKSTSSEFDVYPLNGFFSAFAPGPISSTAGLSDQFLLKVSQQEILAHQVNFDQPGYTMPVAIKNWPAFGDSTLGVAQDLAPFFDSNNNGCYDPQNGDHPIIKGDEAIYWINHPYDKNLELEYHWMMYGYASSDTALSQTLFVDYTIVNRANIAYDSVKVGLFFDSDVGDATDDFVGSDSLNDIMYSYNGSLFDAGQGASPGYGNNTPAVGVKFISDPMENMIHYNVGPGSNGRPDIPQHWINYMNAKWKNGQSLKYGGNAFNSAGVSNINTTHMYSGDPYALTGWTERTLGGNQPPNADGDRRVFGSIPYFSLQPNERKTIEIAVGFGRTEDTTTQIGQNVRELIRVLNSASFYNDSIVIPMLTFASTDTCSAVSVEEIIANQQNSLSVFPIPSSGELTVETEEKMSLIEVYDMKGALVMSLPTTQERVQLSLSNYRDGFYLIRVQLQDDTWMMKKIIKQ